MRRIAVEVFVVFVLAAVGGAVVARRVLVEPAVDAIRNGAMQIPAPPPSAMQQAQDDRRSVALSSLLDSTRTAPVPAARAANQRPADSAAQPSVRREGTRVHIDLHGAEANSDALAGATVVPRDPSLGGGYVVQSIDQAGLLAAAGIQPGDVIVAVNDMPTRTADEALTAFALARSTPSTTLRLERGNRTFEVVADLVR